MLKSPEIMPHKIPDPIKEWLQKEMPPTHKMWWMRTVLMDFQPMQVQQGGPITQHYYRLGVRDIDADDDDRKGYDLDVSVSRYKDYRPKDRISLFGHEPIDATHLSIPRFFYHHETWTFGPCFSTSFVDRNYFPVTDFITNVEGGKRDKELKLRTRWGAYLGMKPEDIAGRFKGSGFDLQPIYRALSSKINEYVQDTPDAKFACANLRPLNMEGGKLVD